MRPDASHDGHGKIRIPPDADDEATLSATMEAYRNACNPVSEYVFRTHNLSMLSVQQVLYQELREKFSLQYAQMAISVIRTVVPRYKTLLSNDDEWMLIRFRRFQDDLVWNGDYSLPKDGRFSVNSLGGCLSVGFFMKGMENYYDGTW